MADFDVIQHQFLAAARNRREKAQRLKAKGYSYGQIGKELGVTRQRAFRILNPNGAKA